jgi:two-component sensor histidine kinase
MSLATTRASTTGRVDVRWTTACTAPAIDLEWIERGGPPVREPERRGFGITLIERSLAGVGGSASVHFDRAGLRSALRVPLAHDGGAAVDPPERP